jgi:hypothetical protein
MKFPNEINSQHSLSSLHSTAASHPERSVHDLRTLDNSVNPYKLKMKKGSYNFDHEDIHKMETSFQPIRAHSHDSFGRSDVSDLNFVPILSESASKPCEPNSTPLPEVPACFAMSPPPLRLIGSKRDPCDSVPGACSEIFLPTLP